MGFLQRHYEKLRHCRYVFSLSREKNNTNFSIRFHIFLNINHSILFQLFYSISSTNAALIPFDIVSV